MQASYSPSLLISRYNVPVISKTWEEKVQIERFWPLKRLRTWLSVVGFVQWLYCVTWHRDLADKEIAWRKCHVIFNSLSRNITESTWRTSRAFWKGWYRSIWTFLLTFSTGIAIGTLWSKIITKEPTKACLAFISETWSNLEWGKSPLRYAITEKCTNFTDVSQEIRSITQLSYKVCFTSMRKWLIKRRLNSHIEMLYQNIATKSEFVTSVKLPSYPSIFKTLLIQLKLSNPQVKAKDFFCPLEVLKFVHAPKFYRAMRVYSAQFQDLIWSILTPQTQKSFLFFFSLNESASGGK